MDAADKARLTLYVKAFAGWWREDTKLWTNRWTDLIPEVRKADPKLAELLDKHDDATKAVANYARARLEGK